MSTKAAEKIIEALTELVQGFAELQEQLENDFGTKSEEDETDDNESEEASSELQDALVTEVRAAVESVIENEDCAPEDIASVISALTGALEEVAPEVFAEEEEAEEGKESEDEDDEDDEDIDLDDDDYDYDEDEEEEDDEEEEESDDEDDDD
jgi:DNA-binding FrmR family transcriptional regulator